MLIEAVLSAVVIAVGLVWITRGLSSQLQALRRFEEYQTLRSLAHGKLLELESRMRLRQLPSSVRAVPCDDPYGQYRWTVKATTLPDAEEEETAVPAGEVSLTVQRGEGRSSLVTVRAIWPKDRIPEEWR